MFCQRGFFSACERTNPDHEKAETLWGHSPAGLFGYSHLLGGYRGGQAEYLRVPYADVGPIKVPDTLDDEQVLFLSDIFPTGYMAAEFCDIKPGDVIAIWGCGPVGQFAIRSAFMLGAERVIAIDTVPERLELAQKAGAETLDFHKVDVYEAIQSMTKGRGADACIDAVGTEPDPTASIDSMFDRVKVATFLATDRPHVLRQAIHCCRNFGTVSIVGVYGGFLDKIPMGSAINRGLTFRMAQTPVQRYMPKLLERIERGDIDPSFVVTASRHARRGAGALQDVSQSQGRLHQGDAAALDEFVDDPADQQRHERREDGHAAPDGNPRDDSAFAKRVAKACAEDEPRRGDAGNDRVPGPVHASLQSWGRVSTRSAEAPNRRCAPRNDAQRSIRPGVTWKISARP